MTDSSGFAALVPGFDFLQNLVKNAGAALPGIGQWVAPTIDPAELDKRIQELRTVQFWLEQNARMMATTIQALEVQRMTLSTLKTMNVQMEDLRDSLQIRVPAMPEAAAPAPAVDAAAGKATTATKAAAAPGAVDPLQWWGALTKQFTELATTAMKDTPVDAARKMAGAMVSPSFAAASASQAQPAEATTTAKAASKRAAKPTASAARKKAAPRR